MDVIAIIRAFTNKTLERKLIMACEEHFDVQCEVVSFTDIDEMKNGEKGSAILTNGATVSINPIEIY